MPNKWTNTKNQCPTDEHLIIGIYLLDNGDFSFDIVCRTYGRRQNEKGRWWSKTIWKNQWGEDCSKPDYWIEINHELVDFLGPKKIFPIIETNRFQLMEIR